MRKIDTTGVYLFFAVDQWNNTPHKDLRYLTPDERFAGAIKRLTPKQETFCHFHPFGCPVYVVDPTITNGKKVPKWDPRSCIGIYLGRSCNHANNVSWILNLRTDHISAQFHTIYDDSFLTVQPTSDVHKIDLWKGLHKSEYEQEFSELFAKDTFTSPPLQTEMPAPSQPNSHPLLERLGTLVPDILNPTTPPMQAPEGVSKGVSEGFPEGASEGASEGAFEGASEGATKYIQQQTIHPYNCQTS